MTENSKDENETNYVVRYEIVENYDGVVLGLVTKVIRIAKNEQNVTNHFMNEN